jgi:ABC-2 type transport system ATP-binding protein
MPVDRTLRPARGGCAVNEREEIVRADDLCVRFGSRAALDGVTMRVLRGEIMGLVGPNGAGKTTLLRVLATALVPSSGRALVVGFDPARKPREVRRRVGYLPDFMGLYQDMRVDEYLRFFADAYGLDAGKRRAYVDRALRMTGLADRAGSFIEELSLGMRSRVAFARALAGDPALLLLDEPLSGLDPFARTGFIETLRGLRAEGTSVLVSSHQLADLERLCDGVVLMDRGRVVGAEQAEDDRRPSYELVLPAADGAAAGRLRAIAGVARVAALANRTAAFEVEIAEGVEPAATLRAIVLAGMDVSVWKPRETSLEDRLRRAVDKEEPE